MNVRTIRTRLAAAWLAWEDDEGEIFPSDLVYDLVASLRDAAELTAADSALLGVWDRWQVDPDRILPPAYLHGAFADWITPPASSQPTLFGEDARKEREP